MKTTVYGREVEYTDAKDLARKIRKIQAEDQEKYNQLFATKEKIQKVEATPEVEVEEVVEVPVEETETTEEVTENEVVELPVEGQEVELVDEVEVLEVEEVVENSNKNNQSKKNRKR